MTSEIASDIPSPAMSPQSHALAEHDLGGATRASLTQSDSQGGWGLLKDAISRLLNASDYLLQFLHRAGEIA
jgi:hypothetical protein